MADPAPVPAVTRDQAWKALSDLREEFEECDDSDCLDHWCALARRSASALEALLAEAPQPKVMWEGDASSLLRQAGVWASPLTLALSHFPPRVAVVALGPPVPEAPEADVGPEDLSFPVWPDGRPRPVTPPAPEEDCPDA